MSTSRPGDAPAVLRPLTSDYAQ